MSHYYQSTLTLTNQVEMLQNQNNRFNISIAGKAILPGTVRISGKCAISTTAVGVTPVAAGQDIGFDSAVGYHGIFSKIQVVSRVAGVMDNPIFYPRNVATIVKGKANKNTLGINSSDTMQGRMPNKTLVNGLVQGIGNAGQAADAFIPFSIAPYISLNAMDGPICGTRTGDQIAIIFSMASNQQFITGSDVTANCRFIVTDLKCEWEAVDETPEMQSKPVTYQTWSSDRVVMNSNITSLNSVVPAGFVDSVIISFIQQSKEYTLGENFVSCAPPPGIPKYVPPGGQKGLLTDYGIEQIIFKVNDSDTVLASFVQDQREEIYFNYLRAIDEEPESFNTDWENCFRPDGYGCGIPFGGYLNLLTQRFGLQMFSQCNSTDAGTWAAYLFFRCRNQI